MKLWMIVLLSTVLWAECTPQQEQDAVKLWQSSIHKHNSHKKKKLLESANRFCDYDFIALDSFILEAQQGDMAKISEEDLENLKNFKNSLSIPNGLLSTSQIERHKFNVDREIEALFVVYYQHKIKSNRTKSFSFESKRWQEQIARLNAPFSAKTFKAVTRMGGSYEVDLLFNKGKYHIKNHALVKKIIAVMHEEVSQKPSALFGLEGGASSEGSAKFNQKLSKNRAKALSQAILKKYPNYNSNLKVMMMGESQLVCEGGLLPEENSNGEYECPTKEDRTKSRRVVIRRVR